MYKLHAHTPTQTHTYLKTRISEFYLSHQGHFTVKIKNLYYKLIMKVMMIVMKKYNNNNNNKSCVLLRYVDISEQRIIVHSFHAHIIFPTKWGNIMRLVFEILLRLLEEVLIEKEFIMSAENKKKMKQMPFLRINVSGTQSKHYFTTSLSILLLTNKVG